MRIPFSFLTVSDVSTISEIPTADVDPNVAMLVTFAAFTVTVVVFAAFLSIVRKNKMQMK